MNKQIEIIKKTRINLLNVIKDLTLDQLNEIPEGFNNNIIWNLAHLIAAQQGICYMRAGGKIVVDEKYFLNYKSETKPQQRVDQHEVDIIKQLFLSTIDRLEKDYQNDVFANYTAWTTRYGVELAHVDDALVFLPFHEGLHLGYIQALKRVIKK
ncbi:MAG: DinB family protein [Bacteroidota bacterium]